MELHCRVRLFQLIGLLFLFLICVHGRRKYPQKVHAMVQEQLARRRYGSEVGQWSGWGVWSPCSRSCGGGIRTQIRLCFQRRAAASSTASGEQQQGRAARRRLRAAQCIGSDKRFHVCNEQSCPDRTSDFRAEQCTSFNEKPYNSKLYRWRPHYSTTRPCSLTCRPENSAFYVTLQRRVMDGTRCSPDGGRDRSDFICAAGVCKHIGCDGVVGSPRIRDACGVCGGNNSTCQIISGIFTEPYLREGYRLVAQIPAGACSIRIEEMAPTNNYLALRDIQQRFILNGDWNIVNSGQYPGAGASFVYRRQSEAKGETITAVGPITQPVDLFILYRQTNRGIKYEYAIKKNDSLTSVLPRLPSGSGLMPAVPMLPSRPGLPQRPPVQGNVLPQPSVSGPPQHNAAPPLPPDGPGGARSVTSLYHQRRGPHQADRRRRPGSPGGRHHRGQRTDRRGAQHPGRRRRVQKPGLPQPAPGTGAARSDQQTGSQRPTRPGNGRPSGSGTQRRRRRRRRRSRFQWVVPGYSECTKTCGGGTRVPEVVCMRRKRKQLAPDSKCNARRRPRTRPVLCNTTPCPASGVSSWEANEWSACSRSCGAGHQTRTFLCVRGGQPVVVTECVGRPTEPETQPCNDGPCQPAVNWHVGQWSPCSVSCGWGTRTRSVTCTEPSSVGWCPEVERPRDTAPCRRAECPVPDPGADSAGQPGQTPAPAGWMVTNWTQQCSVECGQGVQSRGVACGGGPDRCDAARMPGDTRPCKTDRGCGGIWFTGPWSQCSQECGVGGQATRTVLCVRRAAGQVTVTSDLSCAGSPRPAGQQPCGADLGRPCRPRWFTSDWAPCSVSCGDGLQRRVVACVGGDGRLAAGCSSSERPTDRRNCRLVDCPSSASTSESSDTSAVLGQPATATGKETENKSPLKPTLGPEYQTVEESDNEIQVESADHLKSPHVARLAADESRWTHQLQAQTADQTLTARLARPAGKHHSLPDQPASEPPVNELPVSDSGESPKQTLPADSPARFAGDSWSAETAAWSAENGTVSESSAVPSTGRPAASAAETVPTAATAAATTATTATTEGRPTQRESVPAVQRPVTAAALEPQRAGVGQGQGGGHTGHTEQGDSGNALSADDTDSCTDKFSHCALVKRARLCQTSFYASSCCASCRLVR